MLDMGSSEWATVSDDVATPRSGATLRQTQLIKRAKRLVVVASRGFCRCLISCDCLNCGGLAHPEAAPQWGAVTRGPVHTRLRR